MIPRMHTTEHIFRRGACFLQENPATERGFYAHPEVFWAAAGKERVPQKPTSACETALKGWRRINDC